MNPQGLTAITIENFKGIGQAVTIPLRPVTLLFGANSAGKSTIIQALQYAWEILENRNADVDRTRLGGEVIDLGGFQNLVHGHDLSKSISITLHYAGQLRDEPYRSPEVYGSQFQEEFVDWMVEDRADALDWLDVSEFTVKVSTTWELGAGAYVRSYEVGLNGVLFACLESTKATLPRVLVNAEHPFFSDESMAKYSEYGEDLMRSILFTLGNPIDVLQRLLNWTKFIGQDEVRRKMELYAPLADRINPDLDERIGRFGMNYYVTPSVIPEWGRHLVVRQTRDSETEDTVPFNEESTWVLSQLVLGAGEAVLHELRGLRYLGPIRAVPERNYTAPLQPDEARWANGLGAWDSLLRLSTSTDEGPNLVDQCNHYLNEVLGLGYTVRRENRIQLPDESALMAELRLFAAQYDERDGAELRRRVLEPLERLPRVAALQLHDEKREIDIDPMDIGVGVSQTLPVVVGAVEPNCTIFAVEQPELHIHPAVQSRMGDLFLLECLGTPGRIFLLETHSEHLMLRMLRRIRETADGELPPGYPRVTPEDVQVLYVESEGGVTSIVPLPITEDGDFAQKWPHGFFTEREEDLF